MYKYVVTLRDRFAFVAVTNQRFALIPAFRTIFYLNRKGDTIGYVLMLTGIYGLVLKQFDLIVVVKQLTYK